MFSFIYVLSKFWGFVQSFLNTKVGQIVLIITIITLSIIFAHQRGFNKGVQMQQETYQAEYEKLLAEKLKEQRQLQEKANQEAIDFVISQQAKEVRTVEKIKEIEKIIERNPQVKNTCARMKTEDFEKYLKELREIE